MPQLLWELVTQPEAQGVYVVVIVQGGGRKRTRKKKRKERRRKRQERKTERAVRRTVRQTEAAGGVDIGIERVEVAEARGGQEGRAEAKAVATTTTGQVEGAEKGIRVVESDH